MRPRKGYVPTVATATESSGGTLLENPNLLTGKKKQTFSPDGENTVFSLIEKEIDELIEVSGTGVGYSYDLNEGIVTFDSAPEKGTNTITITWRKGNGDREKITKMRFAELYNGSTDSRVFLYGNGTNETRYSDIDGLRLANAEYFPDMNVMAVDSANTPITAMVRHYCLDCRRSQRGDRVYTGGRTGEKSSDYEE